MVFSDEVGNTPQCFTVQTMDDLENEDIEYFHAQIFGDGQRGLTLSPTNISINIFDNDCKLYYASIAFLFTLRY